jgi:Uma2 family endonuclease
MSLASPALRRDSPTPRLWTAHEIPAMAELGFFRARAPELVDGVVYQSGPNAGPSPRRWTIDEYYAMADRGLFDGQRVELIGGEVIVVSPQSPRHYVALDVIAAILQRVFLGYWVRTQGPLSLGVGGLPEPDVSVVAGTPDQYLNGHPTTAVLVVEVSQKSLPYDRYQKASLYARAGIADYWVVNLVDRQVEVHRDPVADPAWPFGARYATVTVLRPGESVVPLAAAQARIDVSELLP